MSVAEIKAQLIDEINNADESRLFEIQNVLHSSSFDIPEYVLDRIKLAKQESIDGKGIPHEEVMKMTKAWLKK